VAHAFVWLLVVAVGRTHVVGGHCNCKTPIDECEGGKETYHHHILKITGFNEEESDQKQKHSVDKIQPPVFALALADAAYQGADAPEYEYECKEVREYEFREYDTSYEHKPDEQVDDTAGSDSSALKNYLKDKGIGDTVNLQVERDGKVLTLAVTLGSSAQ